MNQCDTPLLMRQAKAAAARQNFAQAGEIYAEILEQPEMENQFNVHIQYAICMEKTGQLTETIDQCEQRIHECEETGEIEQLKSLQFKVNALKQLTQKNNQNTANDEADDPLQDEALNTGDFFSLDSQEIIPVESKEEKPQKIKKAKAKESAIRTVLATPAKEPEPEYVEITEKSLSEDRKKQKASNLFGENEGNISTKDEPESGLQLVDQDNENKNDKALDVWNQHEL